MTTREYFRHLRGEAWQADPAAMGYIDDLARLIVEQNNPLRASDMEHAYGLQIRGCPPIFFEVALDRIREIAQLDDRIEDAYIALLRRMDHARTYAALERSTRSPFPLWR